MVGSGAIARRSSRCTAAVAASVVAGLIIAACGTEDSEPASSPLPDQAQATSAPPADVAALEALGSLVGDSSDPVRATFDREGGSLEVGGDGATIVVPADAFDSPTEVEASVVELAFERVVENPPSGRVYMVSAADDVALARPVELVIPAPADTVRVVQAIDREWNPVAVEPDDTTRIPIPHFSTVSTGVVERGAADPIPIGPDPSGDAPGLILSSCILIVSNMFSDIDPVTREERIATGFLKLAYRVCTRALVDSLTPASTTRVELSCVNERIGDIGDDVDIRAAIDLCLAEQADPGDEVADPVPPATDPSSTDVADAGPPADIGPLEWSGEMAPTTLGDPFAPDGPASVLITRTPGADEFEIVMGASISATGVTGCVSAQDWTYEATGAFVSAERIEFSGAYVNDRSNSCGVAVEDQQFDDYGYFVEVTGTGLAGPNFEGFTFELPGVPIRIGG